MGMAEPKAPSSNAVPVLRAIAGGRIGWNSR
jgi:hypothetical protein